MEGDSAEIQAEVNHTEQQSKKGKSDSVKGADSKAGKKRKERDLPSPTSDRPTRERKSIERLIISPDKEIKEFKVPKGTGTALKDIPNIVFKLSKRRAADEGVQALHKVLFGRTAKHAAKTNILQFSGFVWSGNEEKEKVKIKERLERVVKETLYQISDLLDLKLTRALKKEDSVLRVFEFLESPHKTSDKLAEESAKLKKSKKAKKTPAKAAKKGRTPAKSPKGIKKTPRKKQVSDEEDEGDVADSEDEEREVEVEPEEVEGEPEEKDDDDYNDKATSKSKRKRKTTKEHLMEESEDDEEASPKKRKVQKDKRKPTPKPKKEKKPRSKVEKVKEPSEDELKSVISELLQNVDFSKVTFTDVMKQLGEKFKVDLTHRKADLKVLIQEEIARLVGEGDNEDEDSNTEKSIVERKDQEDVSRDGVKEEDEEVGDGEDSDGEDVIGKDGKADEEDKAENMNRVEDKVDDGGEDENAQIEKDDAEAEAEGASSDMA